MRYRLYARIVTVSILPEMEQEFLHSFRSQGVPTLMSLGCSSVDVYLDSWTREALVITVWPTREAAEAAPRSSEWHDLVSRLQETLEDDPSLRIMYLALNN